jgi:hypothetical protein
VVDIGWHDLTVQDLYRLRWAGEADTWRLGH